MNPNEFNPNLKFKSRGKVHPDLPKVRPVDEVPHWMSMFKAYKIMPQNTQIFRMGVCSVIFMPPTGEFLHRMIIATQTRYPTIDEVIWAWKQLVPNADDVKSVILMPTVQSYDDPKDYSFTINEVPIEQVSNRPE